MILNAQQSNDATKIKKIFIKAYRESGIVPPAEIKDLFLVFPLPKEKLKAVIDYIHLAIIIKLDEIVDRVVSNFFPEELLLNRIAS